MTASFVDVRNLRRVFDVSKPWLNRVLEGGHLEFLKAVDGVTFDIRKGETFGLADERERLALPDVEGDAVDRLEEFEMTAFQHTIEPRLGDVEHPAQIAHIDKGGRHAAVSLTGALS